jgi:hypothetical protein
MKKVSAYMALALLGLMSLVSCGPSRFILEVESRQDSESEWKREQYSLYYFESDEWYTALEKAEALQWKAAMDIWMGQLESGNVLKRACAAYNLSTACYMLGDYNLASEWLDQADKEADLLTSEGLRKRINAKKN